MLAVILGYLAITTSSASCYSYTKGLASIGISRLARYDILFPPLHNTPPHSMFLEGGSFSTPISLPTLARASQKGEFHTNDTLQPYFSKTSSLRFSSNGPSCRWFSTIMIYTIHVGRYTYIYAYIFNPHLSISPYRQDSGNPSLVQHFLLFLVLQFFSWLTSTKDTAEKSSRLVQFYVFSGRQFSIFNFLRCPGLRRLRASRRVLVDSDEFQIMRVGRGAFATITRVLHKPSASVRVMKRIVFDKGGLAKEVAQAEVDSLKAMAGNVWFPVLLNHFADDEEFIITMPFYARGDMAGLIRHKGYLGSGLAQFYCAQLVLAIQSLHKQGIIHRDIKPDNMFLDEGGHLILADLGLAENIGTFGGTDTEMDKFPIWKEAKKRGGEDYPLLWVDGINPLGMRGIAGTHWYTAPEIFRNERYSFGVDYYSVGVAYYELVTGNIPFDDSEPYPENKRPVVDFRWKPGQMKSLVQWEEQAILEIIAPNPKDRPQTVGKLKANALFVGIDWKKMASRDTSPPPLPLPLCEG